MGSLFTKGVGEIQASNIYCAAISLPQAAVLHSPAANDVPISISVPEKPNSPITSITEGRIRLNERLLLYVVPRKNENVVPSLVV